MSNRRRPERRDAHGAPVRTRNEILIAIGTAVGVVVVTALLLVWRQNEPPASTAPVIPSTKPVSTPSSTSSTSVTTASSTTSTTKP